MGFDEKLHTEGWVWGAARAWGNGERNFRKEKRSNQTHASTTVPDARLHRKADGHPGRLCFMGHVLMENRNGLAVDAMLTHATGKAERQAALTMLDRQRGNHGVKLGADKAYASPSSPATCASARSPLTLPCRGRSASCARPPLMGAPHAMPATQSASASANASRRYSAGSRSRVD